MASVKNSSVTVNPGLVGIIVGSTAVSLVAGEEGRLIYRGYDIADLAASASFEEVAFLLWHGRLPSAAELGRVHVRTARPSSRTVHAPHAEMPQPNFVPVRPSVSRSAHRSGISGSTSSACSLPLTVIAIAMAILAKDDPQGWVFLWTCCGAWATFPLVWGVTRALDRRNRAMRRVFG